MSRLQAAIIWIMWIGIPACWALGGLAFADGDLVDGFFTVVGCPVVITVVCRAFWDAATAP